MSQVGIQHNRTTEYFGGFWTTNENFTDDADGMFSTAIN